MSVKQEAEIRQTQAGRPAYKFQLQTDATIHRHLEKIGASMRRSARNGQNPRPTGLGEAGRPHFAASRAQLRGEATSTDPLAYT